MTEAILMAHVAFGIGCILAAAWVFVDALNAQPGNLARIRCASRLAAVFMWASFLVDGYWYVACYPEDKAVILRGPWPFAHNYFMETKEHLVITLLMAATYLPIAAGNNLAASGEARRLALWVSGTVAALGLAMEAHGAVIALGVKMGLLRHS